MTDRKHVYHTDNTWFLIMIEILVKVHNMNFKQFIHNFDLDA